MYQRKHEKDYPNRTLLRHTAGDGERSAALVVSVRFGRGSKRQQCNAAWYNMLAAFLQLVSDEFLQGAHRHSAGFANPDRTNLAVCNHPIEP